MNAIGTQDARPDKLGTDPMVYGGINKNDVAAETGRNLASKHQILRLGVENEQTG